MPSNYSNPDVIVEQRQRQRTAPRLAPQLSVVVVGPSRQIEVRQSAGTYVAGQEFQALLPNLSAGAIVDEASLQVLLAAEDTAGRALGTFELEVGVDAILLADNETIQIGSSLAIEYSILSARNNNQADTLLDDDRAEGTPDGIFLTDSDVDFLGRGSVLDTNTFVIIDSPAANAGRYRIVDFVPSGTAVYTVRLLKVDDDNVPEVQQDTEIDASALPVGATVYGFPADHLLGIAAGGAETSNIVLPAGTPADEPGQEGVGVIEVIEITTGEYEMDAADITALLTDGTIDIPNPLTASGDAVSFEPGDPGVGGVTGVRTPAWVAALSLVSVGDWVRFEGDFGDASNVIADYQIISIDTVNGHLVLQNTAFAENVAPDVFTLDSGAGTWPDLTSIKFLRVARGSSDAPDAAGDYLVGTAQGVPFQIEIVSARPGVLTLAETPPVFSGITNTVTQIERGIPFVGSDVSYDITRRITSGFTGDVLASYEAVRQDLALDGLIDIGDQRDIEERLGLIHPNNQLALMADMVARSGLTAANRVFFALSTTGDTLADYQAALDTLQTEDVYFIVPATQDKAILDIFKAHVDSQSQPENKHERVLIASTPIATTDLIYPLTEEGAIPSGTIAPADPADLVSAEVDWSVVSPGDVVKILASNDIDAAVIEERRIRDVNSGTNTATMLSDFSSDVEGSVYFRIDSYPRTKLEQAEFWRDEAQSYADRRVMLIRGDQIEITYTDKTGSRPRDIDIIVGSQYACASWAGLASSLQPQAPMTNVPIPGINRVFNTNGYFTPDQLNTIAEGGNNILIQDTRNSSPASRHQLTTDRSSLETQEFSIVKIVDFVAKYFRSSLRPYIGKHNINREVLSQLRGTCEAILRGLREAGVLLQKTALERLIQDPDQPDSIIVDVALDVPYPLNRIVVRLYF